MGDMRRLGRSLDSVVLVDNSPLAAGMCPENAILCSSWFGDDYEDVELEHLVDLLWTLRLQPSIPAFLTERFGFPAASSNGTGHNPRFSVLNGIVQQWLGHQA